MSDALPAERAMTDDEKLARACDWSDYRKDYGVSADPDELRHEHMLFCAGWDAGRRSAGRQSGERAMSDWTRAHASGLAETAMKAGLTPDVAPLALEVGARMLAHGFTSAELDAMILWAYQRAPRGDGSVASSGRSHGWRER